MRHPTWRPTLPDSPEPISRRLLAALSDAVAAGELPVGARLPPQREIAHRLGVSLGAVTRAFAEAERQGLIAAHVGRGSFVTGPAVHLSDDDGPVDLSRNLPILAPARARLAEAVTSLPRMDGFLDAVAYAPAAGGPNERRAMTQWIKVTSGLSAPVERVLLTSGGQQALALAAASVCRPGEALFCEAATYYGVRNLADHAGYRLTGLAMDSEGLIPEALDAAEGARVVVVLPTLQNPTGRTMGEQRRRRIAEVARRRDLWIIEDDVYGGYAPGATPLAALAPERTFFITSLSKTVAPGLRAGALVLPTHGSHEPAILRAIQALSVAGNALGWMIAARWIESGVAADIAAQVVAEASARQTLARTILGGVVDPPASTACPHLWLPMDELTAERVAGRAARAGVQVTPPSAPIVDADLECGLRICLSGPAERQTLERGLRALSEALSARPESAAQPMV